MKDTGKVNIHGKDYETVASRVKKFRDNADNAEFSIMTQLVERNESEVVFKASIINKDGKIVATGHAEEKRSASTINNTSALEVCETSAIGRALANFGLGGTEFASADEVAQAIKGQSFTDRIQTAPKTSGMYATEAQVKLLLAKSREYSGLEVREDILNWFEDTVGKSVNKVLKSEVDAVLSVLEEAQL